MDLVQIYQCFCDQTRLRILHLLTQTPLCVCHFQAVLREPQVKVSKHLAYLRARDLVETKRRGNWIIYSLPSKPSAELETNLKCLQDCAPSDPVFARDLQRLAQLQANCCPPLVSGVGGPGSSATPLTSRRKSSERLKTQ